MYNLGNQFKLDLDKAKVNPECVVSGTKFRFSILTERLIRLEYSDAGVFEDQPTEFAWYRNFPKPEFQVEEKNNLLIITTTYYRLTYVKEAPFMGNAINKTANLKVELLSTDRVWYYGHPEARNYMAPALQTDEETDNMKYNTKGLYSVDGFASIDDSKSNVLNEYCNCTTRINKEIDI